VISHQLSTVSRQAARDAATWFGEWEIVSNLVLLKLTAEGW
jgi:hypothetical protein